LGRGVWWGERVREKGRVGEREGVGLEIIPSCSEV
jgi:hypothetical protein